MKGIDINKMHTTTMLGFLVATTIATTIVYNFSFMKNL